MTEKYKNLILSKVPREHDGEFYGSEKDVSEMSKILLRNGYAVLVCLGDFENEYAIHWIYGGTTDNPYVAQYEELCLMRAETLEEYTNILKSEWEDEKNEVSKDGE